MALSSILDIFQRSAAPAKSAADPNPTVPSKDTVKSDGTKVAALPAAGEGDKSPLAGFEKLWDNNETPEQKAAREAASAPIFKDDPKKLLEAAKTIDFTKIIPVETAKKAIAGGDGAPQAFMESINLVAQAAYAQSAHATTKIVEAALTKQRETLLAQIPDLVRRHAVSEVNRADNPLFTNPASAPMLKMLEDQLVKTNPTASAAEINTMAKAYLADFAKIITESAASRASASVNAGSGNLRMKGDGTDDWSEFFGVPKTS